MGSVRFGTRLTVAVGSFAVFLALQAPPSSGAVPASSGGTKSVTAQLETIAGSAAAKLARRKLDLAVTDPSIARSAHQLLTKYGPELSSFQVNLLKAARSLASPATRALFQHFDSNGKLRAADIAHLRRLTSELASNPSIKLLKRKGAELKAHPKELAADLARFEAGSVAPSAQPVKTGLSAFDTANSMLADASVSAATTASQVRRALAAPGSLSVLEKLPSGVLASLIPSAKVAEFRLPRRPVQLVGKAHLAGRGASHFPSAAQVQQKIVMTATEIGVSQLYIVMLLVVAPQLEIPILIIETFDAAVTSNEVGKDVVELILAVKGSQVASLTVDPIAAVAKAGEDVHYTVRYVDAAGVVGKIDPNAELNISSLAPVDGICLAASCKATSAGTHTVTASDVLVPQPSPPATLEIQPGPVTTLTVSPQMAHQSVGVPQHYTVVGDDRYHNDVDVTSRITWTIAGTPCDGAACTGTTPDRTDTVVASLDGTDVTGEAQLEVLGVLDSLKIYPAGQSTAVGHPAEFQISGYDASGAYIDLTRYAVLAVLTPDGSCTSPDDNGDFSCTPAGPGNHHVSALVQVADRLVGAGAILTVGISQVDPMSGTTTSDSSTSFTDQLVTTGQTSPVVFQTTTPATGLNVSLTGAISVTSPLGAGPHTVSGTDSDTSGNTGVWSYTLTVPGGTITQIAPTSGCVHFAPPRPFSDQLVTTGQSGAVTFATTVPAAEVSVSPTGAISVTNQFEPGTYTISGTDSDTTGGTGVWSYTLSVCRAE